MGEETALTLHDYCERSAGSVPPQYDLITDKDECLKVTEIRTKNAQAKQKASTDYGKKSKETVFRSESYLSSQNE